MNRLLAAAAVALGLAARSEAGSVPLGDLTITFDDTRWEIVIGGLAPAIVVGGPGALHFRCIAPECWKKPIVSASAVRLDAAVPSACSRLKGEESFWRPVRIHTSAGIGFSLHATFSGCRAYTPAHREACGSDDRFAYTFGTGAHFGCGGIEGVPEPMLIELLSGIARNLPAATTP